MIQTASMVLRNGTKMLAPTLNTAAARDARLLMAHALEIPPERLTLELSIPMTPAKVARFESLIKRRMAQEPVSKIIGQRLFWGRSFAVTPAVLDPRPETETLVAEALRHPFQKVLDLGTGSGCILLSLLADRPEAHGTGSDISDTALAVARKNAQTFGLSNRATFQNSDWCDTITGTYDLVVSNPPYIAAAEMPDLAPEVRDHDPAIALSPGGDGLDAYRRIATQVHTHLVPNGRLMLEIGPTQASQVVDLFIARGFSQPQILCDLDGRDRVVSVRR